MNNSNDYVMKSVEDMIRERQILNNEMNEDMNAFAEKMKGGLRDEIISTINQEKKDLEKVKEQQEKKKKRENGFLGKVKKIIIRIAETCNEISKE